MWTFGTVNYRGYMRANALIGLKAIEWSDVRWNYVPNRGFD